jgi:hypothetical protein
VKAVDTNSLIIGLTNGNPGCHIFFIRKSATDSESENFYCNKNFIDHDKKLPIIFRPPNISEMFNFISPILSISTRTFNRPPGPPTLVTYVV